MLNPQGLDGIYVPVITPFSPDYELDLASYRCYVENLLLHDIQGIVINGTTGEAPTVTWDEVIQLVLETQRTLKNRKMPLIIGTGTNDTLASVKKTEQAGELGADAVLVVTPYYSRPSMEGIIEHYRRIAEVGLPVIIYEVPSRTGISLSVDTIRQIMDIPEVIGMKDSTSSTELIRKLSKYDVKPILCGHDTHFHEMLFHGASGGILASANINTDELIQVFRLATQGNYLQSKMEFEVLKPCIQKLFEESNPAPLKWLMARQGIISSETLRLPMAPITQELKRSLESVMHTLYRH